MKETKMLEEIRQYVKEIRKEQEELLCQLAAIPAPSGQEDARAAFCLEYLQKLGYRQAFTDDAKNVVVQIEGKDRRLPVHIYAAHLDTVFPDTETMPVRVTADRIYAPGVGDDTANAAAILLVLKYLSEKDIQPAWDMLFALDSCEEGLGNLKGCRRLMEGFADRCGQFVSLDMGYDAGTDLAVGCRRWRIRLQTQGGHSFWDFGKENAIAQAAELITRLYQVDAGNLPGKVTYNAGQIQGGTSVNAIAQGADFLYEYRADSARGLETMDEIFGIILEAFAGEGFSMEAGLQPCTGREGVRMEVEKIGDRPGMGQVAPCAMDDLRTRVSDSVYRQTGRHIRFDSGSTDCNIPLSMGIPSICFGTWLGAGAHTREEYVLRDSLGPGFAAALDFVLTDMGM